MAEIIGTVASGLQMAGLAAKFVTVGFKVHNLYREMHGASAEIAASLDDIDIIAQILEELGKSPATAHIVLRTAKSHCEKCLQELQATLRALENKIRTSRGFLSKFTPLKFILRKDAIAKMEHRLEKSLRLLLLTILLAIFASLERLEQRIESQGPTSRTLYASIATRSCIALGEPRLPSTSQLNQRYLLLGDTDEDEYMATWSSIFLGGSPRNGGEVPHGLARRSTRSRHHFVRRSCRTD